MARGSQNSLVFDEEEAITFLRDRGYRVVKEEYPDGKGVSTVSDLVHFFYARRRYHNPYRKFPESIDSVKDKTYIGGFVKARQKLGLDRKTAIKECAQIIDALFKYESLLCLETPILSPRILGVRSIIDRVCSFLNGDIPEAGEIDSDIIVNQYNDFYNRYFAEEDLKHADAIRKAILESLNE